MILNLNLTTWNCMVIMRTSYLDYDTVATKLSWGAGGELLYYQWKSINLCRVGLIHSTWYWRIALKFCDRSILCDLRSLTTFGIMESHEESQRSRLLAEDQRLCNLIDSVYQIPMFQSTNLTRNTAPRPGCQFSCLILFLDDV